MGASGEFAGERAGLFELVGHSIDGVAFGQLTARQKVLLGAGLNYQALTNAGAVIAVEVLVNSSAHMRLASDLGELDELDATLVIGELTIRSLVPGEAPERLTRHVALPDASSSFPVAVSPTFKSRALLWAEKFFPMAADDFRQGRNTRSRANSDANAHLRERVLAREPAAEPRVSGGAPAVIVGMYWLSGGGAESWALATVERIAAQGLVPLVITDVPSAHELADHPSLTDAVVVVLDSTHHPRREDVVRSVLSSFDVRGVMIHHSNAIYELLPLIRSIDPSVWVVDALHTIEWGNGGYPMLAGMFDNLIDEHHVISEDLAGYLTDVESVSRDKIVVAPLLSIGARSASPTEKEVARSREVSTLGFVGRLSQQKRPLLFVMLIAELAKRTPKKQIRAIVHGSGPLEGDVRALASRLGVLDRITFRSPAIPTSETYHDIDVLVVSSQLEGLTLTTMEATHAGVPVLSADVGAQRYLVSDELIVSRSPRLFVAEAAALLGGMANDPHIAQRAVDEQHRKLRDLSLKEDATQWLETTVRRWAQ